MGSYATITIGKHKLTESKNTYHKWFFDDIDRIRKVGNENHVGLGGDFIGYRTSVATIRRRLQLAGYDQSSLERDFNDTRSLWLRELKENLDIDKAYYNLKPEKEAKALFSKFITFEHKVISENSKIDYWVKKLPLALEPNKLKIDRSDTFTSRVENEPLISFMLSTAFGIEPEYMGFAGTIFPCMQMESYALALLNMCKDDDICELDITDLVHAGWVDDFEDIEQVQSGETKFYKVFKNSLIELQDIELDESTPVLQRMVFSSVITSFEAYLSDTIKKNVLNRDAIKKRFVKNSEHLKNSGKIFLNNIFDELDKLDQKIINEIDSISYHNVDVVTGLYKNVLLCHFPNDKIAQLSNSVEIRHDIVHRNGKKTDGSIINITKEDIEGLMILVSDVVSYIDKQILDGLLDTGSEQNDMYYSK
ncbi:HEPN/Toprim-associated domain-containing protein [Aeromonas hydrophila]|uniref:HEPN/Toprim-associated domain-containing protein n=1 Tax=Aeromonas hydrophila TaxID=644 RepID=UPI0038D07F1C